MGSIGWYIFRTTLGAFLIVCASVTALMWITQALRDIDLMTNQGQSIFVFIGITGLIIPLLLQIIAPIALMIAVAHVLHKLSNDSELIVMNAAGMPPWTLFRPFLAVGIVVSLLVGAISVYVSPWGLRELRRWATQVRADLVTHIVQPGRFTTLEHELTLHIRERRPNGQLLGIFIDDQREPKERATMLAEQGSILKNDNSTFLVLENGSVHRHETGQRDPAIVLFDSYAFDLSRLSIAPQNIKYSVRERYLWELYRPIAGRSAVLRSARADPRGVARSAHRAALSARIRGGDLRLSGRAAHDPSEPHRLAARRHRHSGGAARGGLHRDGRRCPDADRPDASLPGAGLCVRAGLSRHFPRRHTGAAGFPGQSDEYAHATPCAARGRPMRQPS